MGKQAVGQSEHIMALWIDGEWQRVYTTQQVAEELHYNPQYIAQLCNNEELIAYKIGSQYFIPPQWYKNICIDLIPF